MNVAALNGGNTVRVNWGTQTEIHTTGFELQKSLEVRGGYATVPRSYTSAHGTTDRPHDYASRDSAASKGYWYYRIKQINERGVASYTDPVPVDLTNMKELAPMQFVLFQNYPNPFNPETEIKFSVETTGKTTLRVYNVLGQEVTTLFSEIAEAGRYYKVRFKGTNYATGVYFCRLQSGSKSAVTKLLLLK